MVKNSQNQVPLNVSRFNPYARPQNRARVMSESRQKEIQDEGTFQALYTACSGGTMYHDLRCCHRVLSTSLSETCAITCKTPGRAAPFIYADCVVRDVRLKMETECISLSLEGISLSTAADVEMEDEGPTREEQIQAIADEQVKQRRAKGHRLCRVTEKFEDPKLQFFNDFLTQEGFGGINDAVEKFEPELSRPRKRPGVRKVVVKKKDVVQMKSEPDVEDDAMKAVRMALEACVIDGGGV